MDEEIKVLIKNKEETLSTLPELERKLGESCKALKSLIKNKT